MLVTSDCYMRRPPWSRSTFPRHYTLRRIYLGLSRKEFKEVQVIENLSKVREVIGTITSAMLRNTWREA